MSIAPPLVAVTTSELRAGGATPPTPEGEPTQQEMVLGLKYLSAIERAGGMPVVVPPLREPALLGALLDRVSGLLLTGGPDLDPTAYGARRHRQLGPTWRELDESELVLARLADERQLPVLGICRGLQTLNVARGGTLHQHLPEVIGPGIRHRQRESGEQTSHWVTLTGPSRLADILGTSRLRVNSFHHQGVDGLGARLRPTSQAPDGTIESLEAVDRAYLLGVQWHAECMADDPRQAALFASFVDAARQHVSDPARPPTAAPHVARRAA